ncbi:MAG: dihydropteroate synthase [Candidatus Thorarchaeota archaeon]|nr:dihydropteroate synthase [Candidatus Thorarchaeota archaeon]
MNDLQGVNIGGLMVGPRLPVRVMSVVNLSPESFYKSTVADSIEKFHEMITLAAEEGADIIDIGGVSTAPKNVYGTPDITIDEELERVTSALESIKVSGYPPLSIDTTSSRVAETALDLGVSMVNDVSGLHADPKMAGLIADRGAPVVLMANCGEPCSSVQAALQSLRDSFSIAQGAGIESEKIIVDPGIGFGKPPETDITILRELDLFAELGHPLLVGVSRKAFIGHILDQPNPDDRLIGSLVAAAIAVLRGANVVRTHDVGETKIAVQISDILRVSTRSD